ncbi:MAG: hypothetical protein WA071_17320 [Undibacterium umbellatum]|uniref:phage tail assembly protein T n=1 Tax=Undibacterium umbellatum TaxID=2762300 RepID=UPI003BB7ABD2
MTVRQLEDTLTQKEYLEWCEYASIEPFGLAVQDTFHAHALSMHANMRRDPAVCPEPFKVDDFRLFNEPEEKPAVEPTVDGLTAEQWRQKFALEALAATRSKGATNPN